MYLTLPTKTPHLLSPEQVERFHARGFLHVPGVIGREDLDTIRLKLTSLYERFDSLEGHHARDLCGPRVAAAPPRNPEIAFCLRLVRSLASTEYFERATGIARQLLGAQARLVHDHALLKAANSNWATPWHQDDAYNHSRAVPAIRATLWLPLQPVSIENGCMRFVPGSHRRGLLPHRKLPSSDHGLTVCTEPQSGIEHCEMELGDLFIHHGKLLHGANPNITHRPRLSWILNFAAGGLSPSALLMRLLGPMGRLIYRWPNAPASA